MITLAAIYTALCIRELCEQGISRLTPIPHGAVQEIRDALAPLPQWQGHVKKQGTPIGENPTATCWQQADVIRIPHLFELALDLLSIVEGYLGEEPVLYSFNVFTTYPKEGQGQGDIQEFHTDKDDRKFVACFLYLTDVYREEDGAHQFQQGTQQGKAESGSIRTMLGPAGTTFLSDTSGFHRGLRPEAAPRTVAWIRWGVGDPPSAVVWDSLTPIDKALLGDRYPTDERVQRIVRWVVR